MSLRHEGSYLSATDNAVGADLIVGTFSSTTAGIGKQLGPTSAKTKIVDICADDNGEALAATSYRVTRTRMLVTAAQSGNVSLAAEQAQLKNTGVDTTSGNKTGIWGYYEAGTAATIAANSSGVRACLDAPTGSTIAGTVGALQIDSQDLGGTHTGKAGMIHSPDPLAGVWDYAWIFGGTTGPTAANTHSIDNHALAFVIKVRVGTVDGFVPVFAAAPA